MEDTRLEGDCPGSGGAVVSWLFGGLSPGWSNFWHTATGRAAVVTVLTIPVSTSATDIMTGVLLVFWLLEGRYRQKYEAIRNSPICLASLAMLGLLAVGIFYSSAPREAALDGWFDYRKLALLPIYFTTFRESDRRRQALTAYHVGMFLLMLSSYLVFVGLLEPRQTWQSSVILKIHMAHVFLLISWAAVLVYLPPRDRRWRAIAWIMLALIAINVVFVVYSRTGYVLAGLFFLICLGDRFGWSKVVLVGLPVCVIVLNVLYFGSEPFRHRVYDTVADVQLALDGHPRPGARPFMYYHGMNVAVENLPLGAGTGSVYTEYHKQIGDRYGLSITDPHNEFLAMFIQLGIPGLAMFLVWLWTQWRCSTTLEAPLNRLTRTLFVLFCVHAAFNSTLLNFTESQMYVCLFALFCAAGATTRANAGNASAAAEPLPTEGPTPCQPTSLRRNSEEH